MPSGHDPSEPARRPARRILRVLRWVALGLVTLVILGVAAIHTPFAKRYVLRQVQAMLTRQQIDLQTDELHYNLLDLSLDVRNVVVRGGGIVDAPPFLVMARARADLSLTQLVRGRYVLESAVVDGARVHYVVDADGRDNLPRSATSEPGGEPIDYLIQQARAGAVSVRYENRQQDIDVTVPAANVAVEGHEPGDRHTIRLETSDTSARVQARTVRLDRVDTTIDVGDADARVERLEVTGEGAHLTLTGRLDDFVEPRADLRLRATADVARAARLAGVEAPVRGEATADAAVRGLWQAPSVDLTLQGSGLAYGDLADLELRADGAYDASTRAMAIRSLQAQSPWGRASAEGAVSQDAAGASRLRADVTGLDAAAVMHALGLEVVAATRVDARADLSWPGLDIVRGSGDAQASLTATSAEGQPTRVPVSGRLELQGRDGAAVVTLRDLITAATRTRGRVEVDRDRRVRGALRTSAEDVGRVVSAAEAVLRRPAGSLLPAPVQGGASIDTRLTGTIDVPVVAATLTAPALAVGDLDGVAASADLTYRTEAVDLAALDVRWREAAVRADGTVGLSPGAPLDLRVTVESLDAGAALSAAGMADVPASGTLTATAVVGGTAQSPEAAVTLRGGDLAAYGEALGELTAKATLSGQDVAVSELQLTKPQPGGDGTLQASGTYRLDTRAYQLTLDSSNLHVLSATLPDGRPVRGSLELHADGTGTVGQWAGKAAASFDDLLVDDMALGRVTLDAAVADGRATLRVAADTFRAALDGVVGIDAPYPSTLTARLDGLDLSTLPIQLDTRLDGDLRAIVEARGDLAAPERAEGTATIERFEGTWNGRPFSVTAGAPLRLADERVTIEALRVEAQDSTLDIGGEWPIADRGAAGALTIDARANLATLAGYAPAGTTVSADGRLTIAGTLRGSLTTIDPDLTIALDDGLVIAPGLEPGLSGVQVRARIAEGIAAIETMAARWGTATIEGRGRVPFDVLPELPIGVPRPGGPAELNAVLRDFDPVLVPGAPAGLSGRLGIEAALTAERADLAAVEGRVTFPDLELAFDHLSLAQERPVTIAFSGGRATVEPLTLSGSAGTLTASGTAALTGERRLDLRADGSVDLGSVATFADGVTAEGLVTLDVAARGPAAAPELNGTVAVDDARFAVDEPRVAGENLDARVELTGTRVALTALSADVNGGTLKASGGLDVAGGELRDVEFQLTTRDFAYDAPLELRSLSNADIRLVRRDDDFVLGGSVVIDEAGLTGDINFDTGLLAAIGSPPTLDLTTERNPLLERLRFDVHVTSATPVLVDNNLARAEADVDVRVLGTAYDTGLSGRMTVAEGSEITLNERRYQVTRGVITFIDDRRIQPSFDLELATDVRNYDVTLRINGPAGDTETTLTSDPSLPEPDIMAMLVTGRPLDEMRGEEFDVAKEQVLSYLTGRVGSSLGRGIENATGLSDVRIEPNLIASEADPSARLTLGQELTDALQLIYSTNLTDSSDQIIQAQYDVTRRFQTQATRQSDNTYRMDVRHDVRFGGTPEPRRLPRQRPVITRFDLEGDTPLPEAEMRRLIDVEAGEPLNYFELRDGLEALEERLRERNFLQSRVRLVRTREDDGVALRVTVTAGPPVDLRITGAEVPPRIVEDVRTQWHRGVFDAQRTDDGVETLRAWLMSERYLQPRVEWRVSERDGRREVAFEVTPGPRYARVLLAFEGAAGVHPDVLSDIVEEQDLEQALFRDPLVVTTLLQRYYREQGYLTTAIDPPRYEFEGAVARVILTVDEGPRYRVRRVTASGNAALEAPVVLTDLPVVPGDPFLPFAAGNALQRIRGLYWERGYNDATVTYGLTVDRGAGEVDVDFAIREGAQSVVADVVVAGRERTSDRFARREIDVHPSQPLDLAALSRARRALYETGAYSVVDVRRTPVLADGAAPDGMVQGDGATSAAAAGQAAVTPVRVEVSVREVQPFQVRYGVSFDNERGLGGIVDFANHNTLRNARVAGVRARYDRQLREGRLYVNQPSLRALPVELTASIYYREEHNPATELTEPFNVDRHGVALQGETTLRNAYVWNYGYRFERSRTSDPASVAPGQYQIVAPLTSTFTRERRDDLLDASRGSFTAHAFSYSPTWLGSTQSYVKYLGQYFHYVPLQPPRRQRFTNEILRPRLVFATGVRLGIARGIGAPMPSGERFFAGGSTTLRGFAQNAVGPIGVNRRPAGGEGLLVLNAELRAPLVSIVDGVVFADAGNVYSRLQDFSLTDLRASTGIGVRVRTPWFLLRGDYGFVLDPRPGEARSRFFFSIGQAF